MAAVISYGDLIKRVMMLNAFIDKMDQTLIDYKKQYMLVSDKRQKTQAERLRQHAEAYEHSIAAVQKQAKDLSDEIKRIQCELHELDAQLIRVDKYYVKTKAKKIEELSGKTFEGYGSGANYFDILKDIKTDYVAISKKYSEDILPAIINGLNYLFSVRRKQDYEDLIVLQNTVDLFVDEMIGELPSIVAGTIEDLRNEYEIEEKRLEDLCKAQIDASEQQYFGSMESFAAEIDENLEMVFPSQLIEQMSAQAVGCSVEYGKVNIADHNYSAPVMIGFLEYPIRELIQSDTLVSFVQQKFGSLAANGILRLPVFSSEKIPAPLCIRNKDVNSEAFREVMQGVILSYLSAMPAGNLRINVIDCDNHGNSVTPFWGAKKKIPELFGDKFYTQRNEAADRIMEINEMVATVSQDIIGQGYSSVYDYKKDKPDAGYKTELLVVFDYINTFDGVTLSALKNIVENGHKCGIFTILADADISAGDYYSAKNAEMSNKIYEKCFTLQCSGNHIFTHGLQFTYPVMPDERVLGEFFAKYMLACERIKNRSIVFPQLIKNLLEARTKEKSEYCIGRIGSLISCTKEISEIQPNNGLNFPEEIMLGYTKYPEDVFENCLEYLKIRSIFGEGGKSISMPLLLELDKMSNMLLTFREKSADDVIGFIDSAIWSFLRFIPAYYAKICVFDPERKGKSIASFLDFRKRCPETFDEKLYTSSEDINNRLSRLCGYIDEFIQNKLGGRFKSVFDYNRTFKKNPERLTLLVINDFPSGFDAHSIGMLENILKNGWQCGIYTIICNNKDIRYSSYDNIDELIEGIKKYCSNIECRDRKYQLLPFNLPIGINDFMPNDCIEKFVRTYAEVFDKTKNKGLSFDEILEEKLFSRDLSSGLSIPVGIGAGEKVIPVVFGKGSSHHALVAGATGSGKSTLLHTTIMSSMLHYSPDLLNLYLMDFKSGTEFKIYESKRLPHIKLLALDAMQEFGESILEDLVAELSRRSDEFKRVGASKIGEYVRITNKPMPKILVIMDEFQILFNDATNRKVAYNCAELAKRIVTEGRSYGIHLMMATQSTKIITDLSLASGTLEQMRIRIGLKCGEYDARYLFSDQNDAEALEMMKGPVGTAVLNQEYTEDSNIGLKVAYCNDEEMKKYLDRIEKYFENYPSDIRIFEGGRTVDLLSVMDKAPLREEKTSIEIAVGDPIKVAPPLTVRFDKRRRQNVLICGSNECMAKNITNTFLLSILKYTNTRVVCIDGDEILGLSEGETVHTILGNFDGRFELVKSRGEIISAINELYEVYQQRKKENSTQQIFVVIENLQYLDLVKEMMRGESIDESDYLSIEEENDNDPFDFGDSFDVSSLNVSEKLIKLIDDGTAYGIHFIVSCLEYTTVKECMYYGENILNKFPNRFVFALNENDADSLAEGVSMNALRDNTVVFTDSIKSTYQITPYKFPNMIQLKKWTYSWMVKE